MKRRSAAVLVLIKAFLGCLVVVQGQQKYECARYYQHTAVEDWSCTTLASAYRISTATLQQRNPSLDCSSAVPRNTLLCVAGVPPGTLGTPPPVDTTADVTASAKPLPAAEAAAAPAPAVAAYDTVPPRAGSSECQVQLQRWDQCGGSICAAVLASTQPGGVCGDAPWVGYCCPAQHTCKRSGGATYYQCRPDAPAQLLLSVATHDLKVGEPANVTATLTQGGEPLRNQAVTVSLQNEDSGAVDTYPGATDANGVVQISVKPSAVPATYSVSASSGTGADAVSGTWAPTDNRDNITWVQEQLSVLVSSNISTPASSSNQLVLPATDLASVQVTYTVNGKPMADAVVTIVLATVAANGGSSEVVDAVTANTNAAGIAVAALDSPKGFVNIPFYVNATTASILGNAVVLATATAAPAAAAPPMTVIWSPAAPIDTATSTEPTAAAAADQTAAAAASANVTGTGTVTNAPTKTVTLPIARVDVTVAGGCSPAVQNALITSIQNAVASKLAAAATGAAAGTSYADKIAGTGTCVEGTSPSPGDATPLKRKHLRLLLQANTAAAAVATYSISIDAAPNVTDGSTIQTMYDVFSNFVDQINMDGLAAVVPDAVAAVAAADGVEGSIRSAGAVYGYETRPSNTSTSKPTTAQVPPPTTSNLPQQATNTTANTTAAASMGFDAVPSPPPAAAAAVFQPTLKFTFSTSGDCSDAVSDAVIAAVKRSLPATQRILVEFALMGCSVTPQTGVDPSPGQPTPVWTYYQIDAYATDTVTDPAVLQSMTATFKKFAATVKDAAGLEAAAPGAAAAVATASKQTAKLINASAKLKLDPVPASDDPSAAAAEPAAAAVPPPKPTAAAGVKGIQITRPSVTLTVVTSGSSGCSFPVSIAMISSVTDQIPADLRTSVDVNETSCTEAPKRPGNDSITATYTFLVSTSPSLTNATKINALMDTFSTLSDAVNGVGLEMAAPGAAAAVAAASDDTAEITRADATLNMKTVTLPSATAPTTTTSPATGSGGSSSSSRVKPAVSPSPAPAYDYTEDYIDPTSNSTDYSDAGANSTAAGR